MINVLEARIMNFVEETSIADMIASQPDERNGYMARFAPVSGGAIKDYAGNIDWSQIKTEPVLLELKNKPYFADVIDDVEALLTNKARLDKFARKQARGISRKEDTFLLDLLAKGAGKSITRTLSSPEKAYEALVDANKELSKMDAPAHDRFIIIDHETLGLVEKDARFTKDYTILANGLVEGANINGSAVYAVNTLPADTILAVQKDGVGFARFLDKMETIRLESQFGTGLRGLSVFDGVALDKNCIVKVTTKAGVETK